MKRRNRTPKLELPKQTGRPHLFQFLNFDEWQLVFSVAYLATTDAYGGAYSLDRYATPGMEGASDDWIELFRRALRFLALEHGATFEGMEIHRDGRIMASDVIEPGNIQYVTLLESGSLPMLPLTFGRACLYVQEHGLDSLDLEPIRQALSQVEHDVGFAESQVNPKALEEVYRLRDAALEKIGVRRVKEVIH